MFAPARTPPAVTTPWVANSFTFLNSLGTYVVTSSGLFFLTKEGYGFSDAKNSLLGVVLGATYIVGALGASPLRRWVDKVTGGFSPRAMLTALMLVMGTVTLLPIAVLRLDPREGTPAAWPMWTLVLIYSSLSGMLWPVVESYVSGGRSAGALRRAMGIWNVVWSSAGVVSILIIAPMVKSAPAESIALVCLMHAAGLCFLPRFSHEPAPHVEGAHEAHPPVYARLLFTFRLFLPMSYVVMAALGPYLPRAAGKVEIPDGWQAYVLIAWLLPRVVVFDLMRRWEGWHGRWYLPIAGGLLLVGSFGVTLASAWFPPSAGIALLLTGLVGFGVSLGIIYTAAIYYAMEVGQSEVDAGGKHEALIGVGYTLGPAFGLGAFIAEGKGILRAGQGEAVVLVSVLLLATATAGYVVRRVAKEATGEPKVARGSPEGPTP